MGVLHRIELAVPEQLAQHHTRVGVLMKAVEVATRTPLVGRSGPQERLGPTMDKTYAGDAVRSDLSSTDFRLTAVPSISVALHAR